MGNPNSRRNRLLAGRTLISTEPEEPTPEPELEESSSTKSTKLEWIPGVTYIQGSIPAYQIIGAARFPAKAVRTVSGGTVYDPEIVWICEAGRDWVTAQDPRLHQVEKVCQLEAKRIRFPCIVIRKEPHSTKNKWVNGTRITIRTKTGQEFNAMEDDYLHITVFAGANLEKCKLQGHIYLAYDTNQELVKMTDPEDRKCLEPGEEVYFEKYWLLF